MPILLTFCIGLNSLLGNLCPMQLLTYATPTKAETFSSMTHAEGVQFACKQTRPSRPITSVLPESTACSSGHCLAKSDQSLWLQVSLPSAPTASMPIMSPPFLLITSAPALLAPHPTSTTGPPLDHIHTIVLRL